MDGWARCCVGSPRCVCSQDRETRGRLERKRAAGERVEEVERWGIEV